MKFCQKVMITAALALLLPNLSYAGSQKNPWTQCGIGAMIFSSTPWAAAISNVIWDFGTTASSTTSSSDHYCSGKSASTAKFIYETYANLEEETTIGSGKHLTTMLNILGCDQDAHAHIIDSVRTDFNTSLQNPEKPTADKLTNAKSYYEIVMRKAEGPFAKQCHI